MKQDPHGVLHRPVLTEKSTHGIETNNCYVFDVAPSANKLTIKEAVETLFSVKVLKVNIRNRRGKHKRVGRSVGYGKNRKEAIVTLKTGDKIDVY
jgi:large subunit ribosomal protein L23